MSDSKNFPPVAQGSLVCPLPLPTLPMGGGLGVLVAFTLFRNSRKAGGGDGGADPIAALGGGGDVS